MSWLDPERVAALSQAELWRLAESLGIPAVRWMPRIALERAVVAMDRARRAVDLARTLARALLAPPKEPPRWKAPRALPERLPEPKPEPESVSEPESEPESVPAKPLPSLIAKQHVAALSLEPPPESEPESEPGSEPEPDSEPDPASEAADLPPQTIASETLARLYEGQGRPEKAAQVRFLARNRPRGKPNQAHVEIVLSHQALQVRWDIGRLIWQPASQRVGTRGSPILRIVATAPERAPAIRDLAIDGPWGEIEIDRPRAAYLRIAVGFRDGNGGFIPAAHSATTSLDDDVRLRTAAPKSS